MRTRSLVSGVLALLWLTTPAKAAAQDRAGFWFGIGAGFGSAGVSCDDCGNLDRENSGAGYLKLGWTLSQQALVGIEVNGWSKHDTSDPNFKAAIKLYNVSGTLTYYPQPSSGLFLKGGVGSAIIDVDLKGLSTSTTLDLGKGFGFLLGAGYDIPVWRRVSLTPAVNYWHGQPGDLKILGTTFAKNWTQNVIDFTIGITVP